MERDISNSRILPVQADGMGPILLLLLCAVAVGLSAGSVIRVKFGADIDFRLPSYTDCGQYTLLDSHLKPVVIIEGRQLPNLVGKYADRSSIEVTDQGYNLTISNATLFDSGTFQLTAANGKTAQCTASDFKVVVHNMSAPDGTYFEAWSTWSTCERSCASALLQFRTRSCSVSGGCEGLGENKQNRTCDLADSCPRWLEWGGWSNCSAMCGKGFKIRKRICVNGESALLKSTDCVGQSTQSHLCMTVCEVVGYWDMWGEWGVCTSDCGGGTRNRSRSCTRDSRLTKTSCNGDSLQTDTCNDNPCSSTEGTSTNSPAVKSEEDEPLDIAVLVIVLSIAAIVIILIPIMLLRKHRANNKAVDAIAVDRRTGGGRRKHKTSSTASDGAPQQCQTGINVYSELNSSFVYSSSEFDSVFIDDNGTDVVHVPTLENIAEEGEEHENDVDTETNGNQAGRENVINENEETCEQANENAITESVYFEPPDETKADLFNVENKINEVINQSVDNCDDVESIYYEPPENSCTNSRKISTLSVHSSKNVSFENERKESVYENISNVERILDNKEDEVNECYDNLYGTKTCDYTASFTISDEQSDAAREKEREAYNDDHIYVNASDTPIIEFSVPIEENLEEHIYDIPRNKEITNE